MKKTTKRAAAVLVPGLMLTTALSQSIFEQEKKSPIGGEGVAAEVYEPLQDFGLEPMTRPVREVVQSTIQNIAQTATRAFRQSRDHFSTEPSETRGSVDLIYRLMGHETPTGPNELRQLVITMGRNAAGELDPLTATGVRLQHRVDHTHVDDPNLGLSYSDTVRLDQYGASIGHRDGDLFFLGDWSNTIQDTNTLNDSRDLSTEWESRLVFDDESDGLSTPPLEVAREAAYLALAGTADLLST